MCLVTLSCTDTLCDFNVTGLHCDVFRLVSVVGALPRNRLNLTGARHAAHPPVRVTRVPLSGWIDVRKGLRPQETRCTGFQGCIQQTGGRESWLGQERTTSAASLTCGRSWHRVALDAK